MATDPRDIQLTDEQRRLLAEEAERSGRPWQEVLNDFFSQIEASDTEVNRSSLSLFEVLQSKGLLGAMEGPVDLSTSENHLDGFGEP